MICMESSNFIIGFARISGVFGSTWFTAVFKRPGDRLCEDFQSRGLCERQDYALFDIERKFARTINHLN